MRTILSFRPAGGPNSHLIDEALYTMAGGSANRDLDPVAFAREVMRAEDMRHWDDGRPRQAFRFDAHCVSVVAGFAAAREPGLPEEWQERRTAMNREHAWRSIAQRLDQVFEPVPRPPVFGSDNYEVSFVAMREDDFRELRAYVRELETIAASLPTRAPFPPNPGPSLLEACEAPLAPPDYFAGSKKKADGPTI